MLISILKATASDSFLVQSDLRLAPELKLFKVTTCKDVFCVTRDRICNKKPLLP